MNATPQTETGVLPELVRELRDELAELIGGEWSVGECPLAGERDAHPVGAAPTVCLGEVRPTAAAAARRNLLRPIGPFAWFRGELLCPGCARFVSAHGAPRSDCVSCRIVRSTYRALRG